MTQAAIKRQIDAIERASARARRSKKAAREFLVNAGIIKAESSPKPVNKKNSRWRIISHSNSLISIAVTAKLA